MAMAAKKSSKTVNQGNWRSLKVICLLSVVLVAGGLGFFYGTEELFGRYPIQKVRVVGELKYVDKMQIKQQLAPFVNNNFFEVQLGKVQQSAESLSWIEQADAKKEWPNTLVVTLVERIPVAIWNSTQLLSKKGEVFSADGVQVDSSLPIFIGSEEQISLIADRFSEMQTILFQVGRSITALKLEDRFSWKAELDDGLTLIIDEKDSLEKLKRFVVLYQLLSDEQKRNLLSVDLRYENGLAIEWKKVNHGSNAA